MFHVTRKSKKKIAQSLNANVGTTAITCGRMNNVAGADEILDRRIKNAEKQTIFACQEAHARADMENTAEAAQEDQTFLSPLSGIETMTDIEKALEILNIYGAYMPNEQTMLKYDSAVQIIKAYIAQIVKLEKRISRLEESININGDDGMYEQ